MANFSTKEFNIEDYYEENGLRIEIEKVGGGTLGRKYTGNWIYRVLLDNVEQTRGSDYVTNTETGHHDVCLDLYNYFDKE